MRSHLLAAIVLVLAPFAGTAAEPLTLDQAMADPDWIGPPVEQAWWAWDSQRIHYRLKREGAPIRDTWTVQSSGGTPVRMTDAALADLDAAPPVYDSTRRRAAFVRNGDVFLRDLTSGALTQVTRGSEATTDLRFSTGGGLLWRDADTWYHWRAGQPVAPAARLKAAKDPQATPADDGMRAMQLRLISTLARERDQREVSQRHSEALRRADATRAPATIYLGEDVSVSSSSLSPAGQWLIAVTENVRADKGRTGKMPKYVTESGYEEYEDVRTRVGRNPPAGQQLRLVDVASGQVRELALDALPGIGEDPLAELRKAAGHKPLTGPRPVRVEGMQWTGDGRQAAIQLRAVDNKDRWIATVDFANARLIPAHRLTDSAWINNWAFNEFGWMPDNATLWLLSEHSGYSHLYTVTGKGKLRAVTEGNWEVSSPALSADGRTFLFLCNRAWPGDYEVCAKDLAGGPVRELTSLDGVEDFALSPDGNQLAVRWSSSYTPAQLAVVPVQGGEARRLTDTRTAAYRARTFVAPQFVQVPSRHGAGTIWGKLYRPQRLEPGKRYPIVVFVHGAGYLQNASSRYPYYFREQLFNQLLAQAGYLVLDLDYRASEGYGRDWRTAIYRQMGHPELEDYLDGVDWLVDRWQGDRDRVGIYGGSYGGFMTLMAMFRAPEVFRAGAALRPATDLAQYNHTYISSILNTPDLDPEAYRKSSAIEYAQHLRGHLLIAHGMIDDNAFYQDSVRLVQRLIELKKDKWELASYPMERHEFVHPESWYDEYRRIYELFERTLK